jgi:hypothetical protein
MCQMNLLSRNTCGWGIGDASGHGWQRPWFRCLVGSCALSLFIYFGWAHELVTFAYYGASAADCVAFKAIDLHARLEDGLLQNGCVLFGDNAYLNSFFMATPYSNVSGNPNKKSEDNYNFFHSQLRIRVECAFGMLVA